MLECSRLIYILACLIQALAFVLTPLQAGVLLIRENSKSVNNVNYAQVRTLHISEGDSWNEPILSTQRLSSPRSVRTLQHIQIHRNVGKASLKNLEEQPQKPIEFQQPLPPQTRPARVAIIANPEVIYYHHDATLNLAALSDDTGQVIWRADIRPFGHGEARPNDRPLRFLDQPHEEDIGEQGGLYHLGARFYDPVAGRFLSPDPLSLVNIRLEEPQRFNKYAYGLNNPTRYADFSGQVPVPLLIAGGILLLKGIDYGWTAWDAHQAGKVLADPNATPEAKAEAAANLSLTVAAELAEPDELLPIGLPLDDLARHGVIGIIRDVPTPNTKNWSAWFKSEGEARALARQKLGKNPIEVEPGKWRSRDGKWQYRAKPGDVEDLHIHLEELDPTTGEVLQNAHLRWPGGSSR